MAKKLSSRSLARSLTLYWSHGDDVLWSEGSAPGAYNPDQLQALLNLYSLFSERLAVLDICLLNNQSLAELLVRRGYSQFLTDGVIVPILRDSVRSFEELQIQQGQDTTQYTRPSNPDWS